MTKQLNIRSDEAYEIAHRIATRTGRPVAEAVLSALRAHDSRLPEVSELTPAQRQTYDMLRALSREAAKHKLPGATSDHDDLYDDFGLPK